jgi:hypothetical protein
MEETITIKEIIDILKKEGFLITRDQLWFYVENNILPHPFLMSQGKKAWGCYPGDIVEPLRRFLALRDQGFSPLKAKEILLNENFILVSELFRKRGMSLEKLHHFALPNIEVDESGSMRSDRGFSQFFIDLLQATLWRRRKKRGSNSSAAPEMEASLDAFCKIRQVRRETAGRKRSRSIKHADDPI